MTKLEIDAYRENDALNQSYLKGVATNDPKIKKNDSESVACLKGSLTDVLCLTPELQDDFYYFSKLEKYPTPQIKESFDKAFEIDHEWDDLLLLEVFRSISKTKKRDELVLKDFYDNEDYWKDLTDSQGKTVITQDYFNICNSATITLQTHPFTTHHFDNSDGLISYQVPIYDEIVYQYSAYDKTNVKRKGLLDLFIKDEVNKTVQFKDLKTTSSTPDSWFKQARQFGYPFQCAWYYDIINNLFPDYKQLMPELIVYSFAAPSKPFTKVLTEDDLFTGRYGVNHHKSYVEHSTGLIDVISERVHGWEECLTRYLICQEKEYTDWDIDYWENKGIVTKNIW